MSARSAVAWTVASLALVASATMFPVPGAGASPGLCILCGRYGLTDFLLNIGLFMPLGFALRGTGLGTPGALAMILACTFGIEFLQLGVIEGRDASLGDLVANTLGGAAGITIASCWRTIVSPSPRAAARLTIAAWIAWTAITALSAWALQPAPLEGRYRVQVQPAVRGFARFAGRVDSVQTDGIEVPEGGASGRMPAEGRRGDSLSIALRTTPGPPRRAIATLATLTTGRHEHAALVAKAGTYLVFARRLNAGTIRLRSPSVALGDAFPSPSDLTTPTQVRIVNRGSEVTLSAWTRGLRREATVRLVPEFGWILLAPGSVWLGEETGWLIGLISTLWIALLAFPASFWATVAGSRPSMVRGLAVGTGSIAASWALVPLALSSGSPGSISWIGLVAGSGVGALVSFLAATVRR